MVDRSHIVCISQQNGCPRPAAEDILVRSRSRVRRKIHELNSARVQSETTNSVAQCPWEIKWDD